MASVNLKGPDEKKVHKYYTEDHQRDPRWMLEAHLDCKGIDMKDTLRLVLRWITPENRQAA